MVERSALRYPAMAVGILALALGVWTGLDRVGWALPVPSSGFLDAHGALMVNGVLATLIGLERAVALERRGLFAGPLLTGAGSLLFALALPWDAGVLLLTVGSAVIVGMFLIILSRQPAVHTMAQLLGAASLLVGNLLWWSGLDVPYVIPWWGSFLVLVIVAERLELTRVLPISRTRRLALIAMVALDVIACVVGLRSFTVGTELLAVSWVGMAAWLLVHDVARRNLSRPGVPRFTAVSLLSGHLWLLAGGLLILAYGGILPNTLVYDAQLHAVFLGFVLSMVFAHATIIVPAVLGRPVPFHRFFYAPLVVLDLSVGARVGADLLGLQSVRAWASLFNVVAIVAFGISLLLAVALERSVVGRAFGVDSSTFYP